uniref:Uncharacterized protein n=1 Tax=Salarias fasciatus TaxID=181472 RepID=A0A672HYP3_SALFA
MGVYWRSWSGRVAVRVGETGVNSALGVCLQAYMPRGQFSKRADQCDTSALLNLICNCKGFWFVDPKVVREVIRSRNELMHSSEFHMSDDWMRDFQSSLKCFVLQLVNQNPQMETVARQIDVVSDAAVRVDCRDGVEADSMCEASPSADSVRQWEAELLQELLQEFLHTPAEDEDADAPVRRNTLQSRHTRIKMSTSINSCYCFSIRTLSS